MTVSKPDRQILRGLARRLADVAALPVQQEKRELWRRLNRLERVRPLVLLYNWTWTKTFGGQIELPLRCEGEFARDQEWFLREKLSHWDNMRDDHVYEAKVHCDVVDTE